MTSALHITMAQINPVVGDLAANAATIRRVWQGAPARTDLVVLPELALCGYPAEDLLLKPSFLDMVERLTSELAAESADRPALVLPVPWRMEGKTFNVAHVLAQGRIQQTVAKHHLPNYGVFDECRVFRPGPLPVPVTVKGHRIGLMVCEDMWFPDVSSALKDGGAEMLVAVNASPFETGKHETRIRLARRRVAETGLPLIYVAQCGGQDDLVFDGASFVLSEGGRLILQAEEFVEDVHHTVWEKSGAHWLCLTDTIHETHEPAEAMYQAVMTGLRDYVTKNGFGSGVLLGLSGGVDSALVAALAVDALGPDLVHGAMMPSRYTAPKSLEDAAAVAKTLGMRYDVIPLEGTVEHVNRLLSPHFTHETPGVTFENIQSRSRGLILMALSNATGRMLLSTGNKSEMAVGYATLYGDMCGGYNPLKDVYKTKVYELCAMRNERRPAHALGPHGAVIPRRILTRAPSAELRANQTDQDTLPPYDILDGILECLVEGDLSVKETAAKGYNEATAARVARMLRAAEYKRYQSPPGPKVTARAFGRERRYPLTDRFGDSE